MKKLNLLFTALLLMCCVGTAKAHDFAVDGIYYNILSNENKTVAVTYRGERYDSYLDEYSGDVTIPAKGHVLTTTVTDAKCGEKGSVVTACSRCNYSETTELEKSFDVSVTAIGADALNASGLKLKNEISKTLTVTVKGEKSFGLSNVAATTVNLMGYEAPEMWDESIIKF